MKTCWRALSPHAGADRRSSGREPTGHRKISPRRSSSVCSAGGATPISTTPISSHAASVEASPTARFDVQEHPAAVPAGNGSRASSFAVGRRPQDRASGGYYPCGEEGQGRDHINIEKQLREIARDKHYWEQKRDRIRLTDPQKVGSWSRTMPSSWRRSAPSGRRF